MKKKLLTLTLIAIMAIAAMFAFNACKPKDKEEEEPPKEKQAVTATYGAVGRENFNCFDYATVTIDKDGKTTAVEIGEAFGPTGKLSINASGVASYRYPLYGYNTTAAAVKALTGTGSITEEMGAGDLASKQAAIKDKYFFSIAGEKFVLTVKEYTKGENTGHALVFVSTVTATKELSDTYLAANIKWYVDAAKAGTVFACDADGAKLGDWEPQYKAVLKSDEASTYTQNLNGKSFKRAMDELAAFAKGKDCVIEYETVSAGGNADGKRVKGLVLSGPMAADGTDVTTGATTVGNAATTFLQYQVSYIECAVQAKALAAASQANQ